MSSCHIRKWNDDAGGGILPRMARQPLAEHDKRRVGQRITALREARGLRQNTLAAAIGEGLTPQKLNNYERGRVLIPVHVAARLCAVTGANFDYIYRGMMGTLPQDLLVALTAARDRANQPALPRQRAGR